MHNAETQSWDLIHESFVLEVQDSGLGCMTFDMVFVTVAAMFFRMVPS